MTPAEWIEALGAMLHHGNAPVAVALTDLDDFKGINDEYGHDTGDRVLVAWERTFASSLPKGSVVARLGGDEYVAALPGHTPESALIVLEEVRAHFASHEVDGVDRELNATIGVAASPAHGTTADELQLAASTALMRGKREGGRRVAIYVEEKMTLKSNYYSRAALDRLAKLSGATSRTEASLLREALDDIFDKYRDDL